MKVLLVFALALGVTLVAAYLLGWRNLGNQPPVVPQKLIAQMSVKPASPNESATTDDPIADMTCAGVMQAVQSEPSIARELDWLAGYIAARNDDGIIAADKLAKDRLRTELLAVCAEFPSETLKQAAERLVAKLRP